MTQKLLIILVLTLSLIACSQIDNSKNLEKLRSLSEKTGIEMIVIAEAEAITNVEATRFLRHFTGSSYVDDPINTSFQQNFPKTKTVELPGISFLVKDEKTEELVDTLNNKLGYRNCLAFISNENYRDDKRKIISIIHSSDKYNTLRFQETTGGSNFFSTDSLITKLKIFEQKYPFKFIGVGDDWLLIKTIEIPKDWIDLSKEVLKVCPTETSVEEFAIALQKDNNGKVFMWWD